LGCGSRRAGLGFALHAGDDHNRPTWTLSPQAVAFTLHIRCLWVPCCKPNCANADGRKRAASAPLNESGIDRHALDRPGRWEAACARHHVLRVHNRAPSRMISAPGMTAIAMPKPITAIAKGSHAGILNIANYLRNRPEGFNDLDCEEFRLREYRPQQTPAIARQGFLVAARGSQ
jgi:hypothetical protein